VPTDAEWGDLLDAMETGTKNHNKSTGWMGQTAGSRAKSACTAPSGTTSGDAYVSDTQANWYHADNNYGTDNYGFRVLPAGIRDDAGTGFYYRGNRTFFWSSSAIGNTQTWIRYFNGSMATVYRTTYNRGCGFSVRCVHD
jgi:uncharacterized protein (TIGR02145 family)